MKKLLLSLFRVALVLLIGALLYLKIHRVPEATYEEAAFEPEEITAFAPTANGAYVMATGRVSDPTFVLGYGRYRLYGSDGSWLAIVSGRDVPLVRDLYIRVPLRIVTLSQWNDIPRYLFIQVGDYEILPYEPAPAPPATHPTFPI